MRPVILVGGVGQRAKSWSKWLPELTAAGFAVRIADVPLAGFASRTSYRDAIAGARMAMLADLSMSATVPVSIIGFSAGGVAAVDYLRFAPELVDKAVAISSPIRGNGLAQALTSTCGRMTPRWIRDLSVDASVANGIEPALAKRVTSIVGAPLDGIVSRRSGTIDNVQVIEVKNKRLHSAMQTDSSEVRQLAIRAISS